MNHQFEIIDPWPKYISDIWDKIDNKNAEFKRCKICNFDIWNENIRFKDSCDIFFMNEVEIYQTIYNYEELCEKVNLTCDEFIIKNILE